MRKRRWRTRGLCLGLALGLMINTVAVVDAAAAPTASGDSGQAQQQAYPGQFQTDAQFQSNTQAQTGAQTQTSTSPQTDTPGQTGAQAQTVAPSQTDSPQAGAQTQTNGTQTGAGQTATGSSSPSRLPSVTATVTTKDASSGTQAAGTLEKPVVQSQGAVLYDATHNQFLFEQNADTRFYPASITKLMTALLVLENCSLEDTVTFSQSAVSNLESGAVSLKVQAGDTLSVKDCLYGLLLKSANEIANGLAEHVSGSVSAFADKMNQRAAALGCTNTHFENPNGLNHSNHYTTARDMALIAKAAFENPALCQIASTTSYSFPATQSVPTVRQLTMGHKMIDPANTNYYYPGIIGGKTGYTSLAGNTLVTCVEKDGVRLIAVILKSKQTHYQDTKSLLDYGFEAVKSQAQSQNQTSGGPGGPDAQSTGNGNRWAQDSNGWKFQKENGAYAQNEQMIINGELYCFKGDQYMVNGWYQIDGIWYFFRPSGGMAKSRWVETNGYWYYVDQNGSLFTGGVTPDGFKVDENGVWIQ